MKFGRSAAFVLGWVLAACDGASDTSAPAASKTVAAGNAAARNESAGDGGRGAPWSACPFQRTREWVGSVEAGRVLVNGFVDLQMAGFRPALAERPGAPAGTLALDLALEPQPNAPVSDHARYERRGAPTYRRGEIWCGGERIAAFDMIVID